MIYKTIPESAALTGWPQRSLRALAIAGKLPGAYREGVGRRATWRIPLASLRAIGKPAKRGRVPWRKPE